MHNPIFLQTMLKAYKYRIYPSEEQKILINKSMGCVRYLYNKALDAKVKHYEKTGKSLSCFDLITGMLKEEKSKHYAFGLKWNQTCPDMVGYSMEYKP